MVNVLATLEATEEAGAKLGVFSTAPAIKNYFANFLSDYRNNGINFRYFYLSCKQNCRWFKSFNCRSINCCNRIKFGGATGYAINPARDLGPRIAHAILPIAGKGGSNWSYAIVPILGPMPVVY